MSCTITFQLTTTLRKALEAEAAADGRTLSDYIRRILSGDAPAPSYRVPPLPKKKGGRGA